MRTLTDPVPLRFRHPPPRARLVGQALSLTLLGWLVLTLFAAIEPARPLNAIPLLLWSACALAIVTGAWVLLMPRTLPPVRFLEAWLLLPRPPYGRNPLRIAYADLFDLHFLGRAKRRRFVVGVRGRFPLILRCDDFETPDGAERLRDELRARIAALPDGAERIRAIDLRAAVSAVAFAGAPWLSWTLLGALIAIFALQSAAGWDLFFDHLIRAGANSGLLVGHGEWFRLVTGNLLHFGVQHLVLNGVLLIGLGYMLERLAGRDRFATLVVASGLAGAGTSALIGATPLSVGFSTSVFGLVGALAYLNLFRRSELPSGLWIPARWGLGVVVVEGISEWLLPGIDRGAHLGGLVGGAGVAWLMFRGRALTDRGPARPRVLCAALATAVVVAGIGAGLRNAYSPDPESSLRVADAVLRDPTGNPFSENEVAWLVATTPEVSRVRLEVARDAMQGAAELLPGSYLIRDTLATLHFRLGDFELAVEEALAAYQLSRTGFQASQLARFEAARIAEVGPYRRGPGSQLEPELNREDGESDAPVVEFKSGAPFPEGAVVHFVAFYEGRVAGHVRIRFGAVPEISIRLRGIPPALSRAGVRFELSRLETSELGLEPGVSGWQVFELDPAVAELP